MSVSYAVDFLSLIILGPSQTMIVAAKMAPQVSFPAKVRRISVDIRSLQPNVRARSANPPLRRACAQGGDDP